MADDSLLEKVHDLSDLELAVLLCLINRQHVLISTPKDDVDDLVQELQLVASKTFGLRWAIVNCHQDTTLEDFASALLALHEAPQQALNTANRSTSPYHPNARNTDSYFLSTLQAPYRTSVAPLTPLTPLTPFLSSPQIANLVIAKNLDRAPRIIQIQALELLRTHRIFTRNSVQAAPKQFVFVPVLGASSGGRARVAEHLNDFFAIAHWHDPADGYANLEEADAGDELDSSSAGSVVKKAQSLTDAPPPPAVISEADISRLAKLSQDVAVDVDVLRYQMNIISFLRMHRAVASGISPAATKHLHQLVKSLAPLHKLDYVTPALVGLAVKKIYLHRIRITEPNKERSMQWGSSLEAVQALLDGVGPEEVMEEVLQMVTAPL